MSSYELVREQVNRFYTQKYDEEMSFDFRGYHVKSGFKYGSDFILYKSSDEEHKHGFALVLIHDNQSALSLQGEIASFVRLADSVKKKALFVTYSAKEVITLLCMRYLD